MAGINEWGLDCIHLFFIYLVVHILDLNAIEDAETLQK